MKDKVLAQLKAKWPGVNLSKTRLDKIADFVVSKITTEDEIDAKLDELNEFTPFSDIAKSDDRQRAADKKAKDDADAAAKAEQVTTVEKTDETPTEKLLKTLLEKVTKLETEKSQTSMKTKLETALGKDVPADFYKRIALPENEGEIQALAEELKAEWTALQQGNANGGLGADKPAGTVTNTPVAAKAVEADINAWAQTNNPAPAKA